VSTRQRQSIGKLGLSVFAPDSVSTNSATNCQTAIKEVCDRLALRFESQAGCALPIRRAG
jgi:hypothetical protein